MLVGWGVGVEGREVTARLSSVNKLTMTSGFDRYACRVGWTTLMKLKVDPDARKVCFLVLRAQEMSLKVEVAVLSSPVPNSPYGPCGHQATLNFSFGLANGNSSQALARERLTNDVQK